MVTLVVTLVIKMMMIMIMRMMIDTMMMIVMILLVIRQILTDVLDFRPTDPLDFQFGLNTDKLATRSQSLSGTHREYLRQC